MWYFYQTALAWEVMESPPSVCPSVCFQSIVGTYTILTVDLEVLHASKSWLASRGLKIIGQGQWSGSPMRSVWHRLRAVFLLYRWSRPTFKFSSFIERASMPCNRKNVVNNIKENTSLHVCAVQITGNSELISGWHYFKCDSELDNSTLPVST